MLESYLSALFQEIRSELQKVKESHDIEAIHDMRVNIKRLRAVCAFIKYFKPDSNVKQLLVPFLTIFRKIGVIRDVQVPLELIQGIARDHNMEEDKLIKALVRKEKNLIKQSIIWFENEPISLEESELELLTLAKSIQPGKADIEGYLQSLRESLSISQARYSSRKWHKKRVILKRYHHVLDALVSIGYREENESEMKLIRIIEALIGDWHDRIVTANHLKNSDHSGRLLQIVNSQARTLKSSSRMYLSRLVNS